MDWYTSKLGDVCELIKRGVAPKYLETGGICVINQKCIRDHEVNYGLARRHDLVTKKVNEERYIKIGDVLVNSTGTGTLGRVAQIRAAPQEPTTVDTHVTIVRPKPNLFHNDFFGYMLIKIEDEITAAGEGASGQTELARTKLENEFLVSYPDSIPEQKRIVAILDQAFADIEQARAKTEQNLKNARELFESYLQQVFSQRGEGWESYKLGEVCELISGQHIDAKNYNNEQKGIGYLTGPSDFGAINPIVTKWTEHPKRTAIKGDILITVKGSGVGKVNVMSGSELAISRQLMAVRPTHAVGDLLYWFLSMQFDYFQSLANGAAIPGISRHDVLDLKLSIPMLKNQQELVDRISTFNLKTVDLERIYKEKLSSLDELKKSILQKAFSGELTKEKEGAVA